MENKNVKLQLPMSASPVITKVLENTSLSTPVAILLGSHPEADSQLIFKPRGRHSQTSFTAKTTTSTSALTSPEYNKERPLKTRNQTQKVGGSFVVFLPGKLDTASELEDGFCVMLSRPSFTGALIILYSPI